MVGMYEEEVEVLSKSELLLDLPRSETVRMSRKELYRARECYCFEAQKLDCLSWWRDVKDRW